MAGVGERRASCCTGDAGSSSGRRRSGTGSSVPLSSVGVAHDAFQFSGSARATTRSNRSDYLAAMAALCSRVGCDGHAAAVFGFDGRAALVWLDPLDRPRRGRGHARAAHADTLTPIRGWTLQDRRAGRPRLWADRPTVTDAPPRPPPAAPAHGRDTGAEPPRPARVSAHRSHCRSRPRSPSSAGPARTEPRFVATADPSNLDELLDARSPLLARAVRRRGLRARTAAADEQ